MNFRGWLLTGVLLTAAVGATADITPPPKSKPASKPAATTPLEIYPARGNTARIEIPRSLLANKKRVDAGLPIQTLMAGLFLSLAMVGGGLWAVRRRGPGGATAVVAGALALGATGGAAWANLAPFPRRNVTTPVVVEVTNRSTIRLELTADQIASLTEMLPAGESPLRGAPGGAQPGTPPSAGAPPQ